MPPRRVAITGLGIISPLGLNLAESWNSLREGRSAIQPIESVDCSSLRFRNGAEVRGFDATKHFPEGKDAYIDRFAQFSVVAAREAFRDSGIALTPELRERSAIVCGSAVGGQSAIEKGFEDLYVADRGRVHPLTIPKTMANAGASHISMDLGLSGPVYTVSTACSSANHAIGQAFRLVRDAEADLAVTGGSEALFTVGMLKAWEAMRVISPDTCRPFSKDRKGMILGEGGAMMILEPFDAAKARGAKIYAEICGFGMTSDAHHLTQPTVAGPARAMRGALREAGLAPEAVGYINAHGTGTPGNDPVESRAIREVFGAHADKLGVSSTKSLHGHALGAAGALEAVSTVLAIHHGILPPTANFTERDPECDLDYIPNKPRAQQVEAALSNSFAFGGLNAVVAFRAV
ncbi:MAG TPA: beta-ketoacyl-[acyl-carrier-protein] synthase family protein [Candidatus Polarisedimenticolia bacterium]|jgi:nodulation protein E|nr:beta-ketoacyl-[acyl-carrier-protein] synthase family protein [Candidatus Polarisedimenticolia bacterium]